MSDVSGISAASNGQYYLRSRQDVQAARVQQAQPSPVELGRVRHTDAPSFAQRIQQFTQGVAKGVEGVADAIKGDFKVEVPVPEVGAAPAPDASAPQGVESNAEFYTQDDLDSVIANFGATVGESSELAAYDFDGDGVIGSTDLNMVLANFVAGA